MGKRAEFLRRLGANIARIRKQKGYSQDRLCLEGGLSRGTVSKIESAKVEAKMYTMAKIAKTLRVSLSNLTDFDF
jgi:transcriptional regulator with XRE-family HTH domain